MKDRKRETRTRFSRRGSAKQAQKPSVRFALNGHFYVGLFSQTGMQTHISSFFVNGIAFY